MWKMGLKLLSRAVKYSTEETKGRDLNDECLPSAKLQHKWMAHSQFIISSEQIGYVVTNAQPNEIFGLK